MLFTKTAIALPAVRNFAKAGTNGWHLKAHRMVNFIFLALAN
jgi:hypothetical protein